MEEQSETPRASSSSVRRTRSQQDTSWSLTDSLTLVNEILAIETDCSDALSTYQKWKIVAENCTALGVSRTMNQYRRKWDTLLNEYNSVKKSGKEGSVKMEEFDFELFKAIDNVVKAQKGRCVDSDPDEPDMDADVVKSENKKQRHRLTPQKRRIKEEEDVFSAEERNSSNEERQRMLAAILRENAETIHAVLKGKLSDNIDVGATDLKVDEASQITLARRQGDKLIDCFGIIRSTLDQLCDALQNR